MLRRLKKLAGSVKRDVMTLYLAVRDPRVPWHAKAIAALVAAYALSPIDLIPDFIPVLGYLDDLIILPLGILLALKMIPADVLADLRKSADAISAKRPGSLSGAVFIILVWLVGVTLAGLMIISW